MSALKGRKVECYCFPKDEKSFFTVPNVGLISTFFVHFFVRMIYYFVTVSFDNKPMWLICSVSWMSLPLWFSFSTFFPFCIHFPLFFLRSFVFSSSLLSQRWTQKPLFQIGFGWKESFVKCVSERRSFCNHNTISWSFIRQSINFIIIVLHFLFIKTK